MESASLRTKINQILFLFKSRPRFGCAAALQSTDNGNVRHVVSTVFPFLPQSTRKPVRRSKRNPPTLSSCRRRLRKVGWLWGCLVSGLDCLRLELELTTLTFEAKSDFGGWRKETKVLILNSTKIHLILSQVTCQRVRIVMGWEAAETHHFGKLCVWI